MKLIRNLMYAAIPTGLILVIAAAPQNDERPLRDVAAPDTGAVTYTIDDVHSCALFRVHHLGAGQFWGRFNDVQGTFTFDETGAANPSFDVTIMTDSVDTNAQELDDHLKRREFFDTAEYPEMTFRSSSVRKSSGGNYEIVGDLTIRGVTKPITAEVEWTGAADFGPQAGGPRCGFEARFTIDRGEFNVSYGLENGAVGREVRIIVGLEGVKQ